jgi:hypothetical protein
VRRHPAVDLISDALPFGRLWYTNAVIRVYDDAGNVIEAHEPRRRFSQVIKDGRSPIAAKIIAHSTVLYASGNIALRCECQRPLGLGAGGLACWLVDCCSVFSVLALLDVLRDLR